MKKNILKLIIVILAIILTKNVFMTCYDLHKNKEIITSYYNNDSSFNYESDMIINISKINLERIVKKASDGFKNLNKNLVYYKSNNPNGKIIIFGHSGVGYGTYFNRLDEMVVGDVAYLYKGKLEITYEVCKRYVILDTETDILKNDKKGTLLLITCDKNDKNRRLVIELTLRGSKILTK